MYNIKLIVARYHAMVPACQCSVGFVGVVLVVLVVLDAGLVLLFRRLLTVWAQRPSRLAFNVDIHFVVVRGVKRVRNPCV